jgi:protein-disulfide isomerase
MVEKRVTKNEKREQAREANRLARETERRNKRIRKISLWTAVGVVIAGLIALVIGIVTSNAGSQMDSSEEAPNNMATNSMVFTSGTDYLKSEGYHLVDGKPADTTALLKDSTVPHIQIFADFDCSYCVDFEAANGEFLTTLLGEKKITLETSPILTIRSQYSYLATNALACVADIAPERFLETNNLLFANNVEGDVSGVKKTLDALKLDAETYKKVRACTKSGVFTEWLETATEYTLNLKDASDQPLVTGTPTILVDGVKYPFAPDLFQEFITLVVAGSTPQEAAAEMEAAAAK